MQNNGYDDGYNVYGIYQGAISPLVNTFEANAGLVGNIVSDAVTPDSIVDGAITSNLQQDSGSYFSGKTKFDNTQTGYILGIDTDNVAKFYIGDTANYLNWTGTQLIISGNITATTGSIGGFDIGADYIRDAANSFGLASTVTGGNDVRFWAGDTFANRGSAPLRLYEDGSIVGTNATFTGALFATSGWIGSPTALVYESQGINTGTTGFIRGGQTSYNTGTGWFLGYDTGAYKLSIGNTTNYLTWDGTVLTIAGIFNINGTTITINNTQDIQTYLDLISAAGGGTLYLETGTYTLTSDISIPSGVVLQGVSRDGVIIDCNTSYAVKIAGTNVYSTGTVTISNGGTTVTGSGTTWTAGMVSRYILLDGLWYLITARASNTSITIDAYEGVDLSGSAYVLADTNFTSELRKVTVTGATGSGVVVQYAMEPNLNDIVVYGCGTGIDMDYVTYPRLLVTSNSNGVNWNANFAEGPYVDFSDFSLSTTGAGIIWTNKTRNGTFFNSSVNDNTGDGMNITDTTVVAFISCDISGNGGQGVEFVSGCNDNQFTDCVFDSNASDGIKLTATDDRNTIVACSVTNNGGYGINIAASTDDNNQIIAPAFDNNTSGNINDSGTNTTILPTNYSFTAAMDLTIGTPVGASNLLDNNVAKAVSPVLTAAHGITTPLSSGRQQTFAPIGGDKFVYLQYTAATSDTLFAQVVSINRATQVVTVGTALAVATAITPNNGKDMTVCKLDTDKFIVFYLADASTTNIQYRVGTVSGTTITFGTAATFVTAGSTVAASGGFGADFLSTDKGIMYFQAATGTNSRFVGFTVSSTTATAGTAVAIDTSLAGTFPSYIKKIGTDKFVFAAIQSSTELYGIVGTLSGTTITMGGSHYLLSNTSMATGVFDNFQVVSPATDVFVTSFLANSTTSQLVVASTVSGTVITSGTTVSLNFTVAGGTVGLYAQSASLLYIIAGTSSSQNIAYKITLSGTTLTDGGIATYFPTANFSMTVAGTIAMDNGYFAICGVGNATNLQITYQGVSGNFIGFVRSTVSRGSSVDVLVSGIDSNQTGLSAGGYYQISDGTLSLVDPIGALAGTLNNYQIVKAISPTQVIL